MRKVALVSVIGFFVTLLVITGFSRSAVAQETYYGCYNQRSGSLRIVSNQALCTNKELPISWWSAEATSAQVSALQDALSETQNAMCDLVLSNNLLPLPSFCVKVVFASSEWYTGDLGGLAGADAKCQTLADAAGLPGTFKAWLSDSTGSPSTRFNKWPFFYALFDGTVVAHGWSDLTDRTDCELGQYGYYCIDHEISLDEKGNLAAAYPYYAWTATDIDGTSESEYYGSCSDWTSSDGSLYSLVGGTILKDFEWTYGFQLNCSYSHRLYCFQQ